MNRKHSIGVSADTENFPTVGHKRTFSESSDSHQQSIVTKVVTEVSDLIPNWLKRNRKIEESNHNRLNSFKNDTESDDEFNDNLATTSQPPSKRVKYPSINGGYSVSKATESTVNNALTETNSRLQVTSATQTMQRPHCSSDVESRPSSSTGSVIGNRNLYLEQNRSIFNQPPLSPIVSKSDTSTSSPNRDPSFNSSVFCSSRISINKPPLSSPFHKGALTYGGASAYQQLERPYNISDNQSLSEFQTTPKRFKVSINPSVNSPLNASNSRRSTTHLSNTAKQILNTLEQFATPIKWAQDTGELMKSNYNERLRSERNEPFHVDKVKEISGNKKLSLEVPVVSQFLQMKLKQHMQNNTENIRKIATGSKSKLNIEQYQLPKANDELVNSKFTLKIKNKVTVKSRQTSNTTISSDAEINQPPTPPNLPNVPLPITTLPQFDLSSNTKKSSTVSSISDSSKSDENFTFSVPKVLTNNEQVVTSVSNFKFSPPKVVVDVELTLKDDTKKCSDVRNNGMILANEINTWECDLCLIKNVNNTSDVCKICNTKRKLNLIGKRQQQEPSDSDYNMFTCVICASKVTSANNTEKKCFRCKIKEEQLIKPKPLEKRVEPPLSPVEVPVPKKTVMFLDINKLFDKNKMSNTPKLYRTIEDVTKLYEKKSEKDKCDNKEVEVLSTKASDNLQKAEDKNKVNDDVKSLFRFGSVPVTTSIAQVETVTISSTPTTVTSSPSLFSFSIPKPSTTDVIDSISTQVSTSNTVNTTSAVSSSSSSLTESTTTVSSTATVFTFGNSSTIEKSSLSAPPLTTNSTPMTTTSAAQVTLALSTPTVTVTATSPIFKFGSSVSPTTTTSSMTTPVQFLFGNNINTSQSITAVTTSISSPTVTTTATQSSFSLFNAVTTTATTTTPTTSVAFVFTASPKKATDTMTTAATLSPAATLLPATNFQFGSKLFGNNSDLNPITDTVGKSQSSGLKRSLFDESDTVKCVFGNNVSSVSSTTSPTTNTTTATGFGSFSNTNQFTQSNTPVSQSLPTFGSLQGFGANSTVGFRFGSSEKTMADESTPTTLKASSFNFGSSSFGSGTTENITQPAANAFQIRTNTTNTGQQKPAGAPVVFGSSPNSSMTSGQTTGFNFGFGSGDKSNLAQPVFGTATSNTQQSSYFNTGSGNTNTMVNGGFNLPTTTVSNSSNNTPSSVFTFGSNRQSPSGFVFGMPNQTNGLPSTNFTFPASAQSVGTPPQTTMFNFSATPNSQPNTQLVQQRRILKASRRTKQR